MPVSVPLRGLGAFGVLLPERHPLLPLVSVPLRGLGAFGGLCCRPVRKLVRCFRPLTGIRCFRRGSDDDWAAVLIGFRPLTGIRCFRSAFCDTPRCRGFRPLSRSLTPIYGGWSNTLSVHPSMRSFLRFVTHWPSSCPQLVVLYTVSCHLSNRRYRVPSPAPGVSRSVLSRYQHRLFHGGAVKNTDQPG